MRATTLLALAATAPSALGAATIVQFNGDLSDIGPGSLSFATPGAQAASSFGTDTIAGQSAGVLNFTAAFGSSANRGLFLNTGALANGGGAYINQYTLIYDVKVNPGYNWLSFFQTNDSNSNDGDAFLRPVADGGGIGIAGTYHGSVTGGDWNRIAFVVDQTGNTMRKFINGVMVGVSALSGGTDGRWSLYPTNSGFFQGLYLLADESGDMTDGSVNSFLFDDRLYTDNEVGALGGASAGGIPAPGVLALFGLAGAAARRRRR